MNTEKEIVRDMYHYLSDHNDPPAAGTESCAAFWAGAAHDICELVDGKWNGHPLAVALGTAMYSYLEHKCVKGRNGVTA